MHEFKQKVMKIHLIELTSTMVCSGSANKQLKKFRNQQKCSGAYFLNSGILVTLMTNKPRICAKGDVVKLLNILFV